MDRKNDSMRSIVHVEEFGCCACSNAQLPVDQSLGTSRNSLGIRGVDRGIHYSFFGGRLVLGPDYKAMLASTFLIVAPLVVFYVLVIPYTVSHMSWAYVFVSIILTFFSLSMLARTAMRDPGFYPRSSAQEDRSVSMTSRTRDHHLNGYIVTTKFCSTCHHYRPPRCSHCAVCDNCVDKFDHHCPWVGNCIGRRNYRTFFLFVLSTTVLCYWVIIVSMLQLNDSAVHQHDGNWGPAIGAYPGSIVVSVYAFLASWFVGGLTVFHSILISKNATTYEHFRSRYSPNDNPYDLGIWNNWKEALCRPTPSRFKALWDVQMAHSAQSIESGDDHVPMGGSLPPSLPASSVPSMIDENEFENEQQSHVVIRMQSDATELNSPRRPKPTNGPQPPPSLS